MSATEAGRSFGADTSKDKNKQEVVGAESKQETKDVPKKSYEDIGKEKREAVMASGKKAWEGLKDKLSGGAKWLKEKSASAVDHALATPEMIKDGVEKVADKTKEKYDQLKEKGKDATDKVIGRVVSAKDKLMDLVNQKLLDKLSEKEAKKQEKLDQRMREKIDPLKAKIDEIRNKKRAILARMKNPVRAQA